MAQTIALAVCLLLATPASLGAEAAAPTPPAPATQGTVAEAQAVDPPAKDCCKICRKGKACGDTCIARNKTCRKPPGCACNG